MNRVALSISSLVQPVSRNIDITAQNNNFFFMVFHPLFYFELLFPFNNNLYVVIVFVRSYVPINILSFSRYLLDFRFPMNAARAGRRVALVCIKINRLCYIRFYQRNYSNHPRMLCHFRPLLYQRHS